MTPKSDEIRASARRMAVEEGLTWADIARKLLLSESVVRKWAKQEGWPRRNRAADRAAEIARSMMGAEPPQGKPVSTPKRDGKKIQNYTSSIDVEKLTSGSMEEMAEAMLRHVFRELASFPSAINLVKLGEMSLKILQIPKLPPSTGENSEKIAEIEKRMSELSRVLRPPEDEHDAGEIPAVETGE